MLLTNIANQPEPSGWWAGNIKEYATTISIDGTPQGLRPGMTAECEILVDHLKDVLTIPVAAVVEQRGGVLCLGQNADRTGASAVRRRCDERSVCGSEGRPGGR